MGDVPPGWALILAAVATGVLALVAGIVLWWLRQIDKKSDAQQRRIEKLEQRDRLGWLYIQRLIISHTTNAPGVPLPPPPAGWLDDDT
ncbi:hypothetical protein [Microbacterium terrisoli]|uniref:hypothetical protein n=1 Tax=Microbacterium terrisoli TaxID=3242192 RepID=UPI0028056B9C|nr:hypothetical protein [Microbacterium protaetiae]